MEAPRRGNEKGRVERAIRYLRTSFFPAREFEDIVDFNAQALAWTIEIAGKRRWHEDDRKLVGDQFEHERSLLRGCPQRPTMRSSAWRHGSCRTPYVRFDGNDYSLPCTHVRRRVTVLAQPNRVRIEVEGELVAEHARSYDRRATIEDPQHLESMKTRKRRARAGAGQHRLTTATPAAAVMIERAAALGHNLGSLVSKLLELLDMHGAAALERALVAANEAERIGASPVQSVLEANARAHGRVTPRPVELPNDALGELVVPVPDRGIYDALVDDERNREEDEDLRKD